MLDSHRWQQRIQYTDIDCFCLGILNFDKLLAMEYIKASLNCCPV